jgi:hypothetical protein
LHTRSPRLGTRPQDSSPFLLLSAPHLTRASSSTGRPALRASPRIAPSLRSSGRARLGTSVSPHGSACTLGSKPTSWGTAQAHGQARPALDLARAAPSPHRLPPHTLSSILSPFRALPLLSPCCSALCRLSHHVSPPPSGLQQGPMPRPGSAITSTCSHQHGSLAHTCTARVSLKCAHIFALLDLTNPPASLRRARYDSCGSGIVLVLSDHVRAAIGGMSHLFVSAWCSPTGPRIRFPGEM